MISHGQTTELKVTSSETSVHPNFWNLCKSHSKEEALTQTKIGHIRRGDTIPKSKKYGAIDSRLKQLVCGFQDGNGYQDGDRLPFLQNIAQSLH